MAKRDSRVVLAAVGDVHCCGSEPGEYFKQCRDVLRQADITFGQFEGAMSPGNTTRVNTPQARICCPTGRMADVLADCSFDIMSVASNHAMDAGPQGHLDTIALLNEKGIKTVGGGANLEQALGPVFLDCNGTRLGFIGRCSVMPIGYEARADRAGVAPLHANTTFEVVDYQAGAPPLVHTSCDPQDLDELRSQVRAMRSQADVVIVSLHFGVHHVPEFISHYETEAAHAVIDEGADLVLGHHPHILKGIEVYKGKTTYYSLANFAMDTRGCAEPPLHWFYKAIVGRTPIQGYPWYYLNAKDPEGTDKLNNLDRLKSLVARIVFENGQVKRTSFLPVLINHQRFPIVLGRKDPGAQEVMDYVLTISRSQGLKVSLDWDGDEVVISG